MFRKFLLKSKAVREREGGKREVKLRKLGGKRWGN
jgi:hypothetical protein